MLEDIVEGIRLNWLNKVKTSYKLVYKHHLVLSSKCHNSQEKKQFLHQLRSGILEPHFVAIHW